MAAPCHELPHSRRGLSRKRTRQKARFRLRQMDQFLRQTLFVQNALDQWAITSGPPQPGNESVLSTPRKIMDISENGVVDRERKLRYGGLDLFTNLGFQLGIRR